MADTKIASLSAASALAGTEVAPVVQSAATVKATIDQIKTWCSNAPTLVTPALGVATATSISIGGATPGTNALAVTGTSALIGDVRSYQAYTDASNNEYISVGYTANRAHIGVDKAGTGTQRPLDIWGNGISFKDGTGGGSTIFFTQSSYVQINQPLKFSGITSAEPGIFRNGAGIDFKLADNSAFANIAAAVGTFSGQVTAQVGSVIAGGANGFAFAGNVNTGFATNGDNLSIRAAGVISINITDSTKQVRFPSDYSFGWASETTNNSAIDAQFRRIATANVRQGLAPNATPAAQIFTLGEEGLGTDKNGAVSTLQTGRGTGAGTIGSLAIQTPTLAASSATVQAYATRMTIDETSVRAVAALHAHSGTAIPAGGTAGAGVKVSSTANFGVFFGSGAPSLAAAKGSFYMRSDGSGVADRAYVNTDGSTAWTAIATAA